MWNLYVKFQYIENKKSLHLFSTFYTFTKNGTKGGEKVDKSVYWKGKVYSSKQVDVLVNNNFKNIPSEKHKSISKKGGIASGIARRKKKKQYEYCKKVVHNSMNLYGILDEEIREFENWKKYNKNSKYKKPG